MSYCMKCGNKIEDGERVCSGCGAPVEQRRSQNTMNEYTEKLQALNNTSDSTTEYDPGDIQNNKTFAILAYVGILVLIPLVAGKDSKFARYHANQGLVLFLAEIAYAILSNILSTIILAISWRLFLLVSLLSMVWFVFIAVSIIGIINASKGRAKELPIIGHIQILK